MEGRGRNRLTTSPLAKPPSSCHLEGSKVPRSRKTWEAKLDEKALTFGIRTAPRRGAGQKAGEICVFCARSSICETGCAQEWVEGEGSAHPPAMTRCWRRMVLAWPMVEGRLPNEILTQLPVAVLGMLEERVPESSSIQISERELRVEPSKPPAR